MAHRHEDDGIWNCDSCGNEQDSNQIVCAACRSTVCIGCAHECADCGESFCSAHICASDQIPPSTVDCYRCEACEASQQAQKQVAA